ncbi:MAG: DUF302 domain-containing protein [Planctomycetota bacterium]
MKILPRLLISLSLLLASLGCHSVRSGESGAAPTTTRLESSFDFETTLSNLEAALERRPLRVFTRIDHAEGAAGAGLELTPATLLLFGNPKVGTPVMQASAEMALDLPLRLLVAEDERGVFVLYPHMKNLAARRGVAADHPALVKMSSVLDAIANETTGR